MPEKIKLTHGDRMELIGCIIDTFEDFLESKGVEIFNPEKDEAIEQDGRKPDELANIYGSDYDDLGNAIEDTLIAWGFIDREDE